MTNPYRRITVNRNAVNNSGHGNASHSGGVFNTTAGYYNTNPKVWGDIIPGGDADGTTYNGSNSFAKNWTSAGKDIFLPSGANAGKCNRMTAKQFYDVQLAAGVPAADILTELNTMEANEDIDLLASLGGSFSAANLSTWETAVSVATNDATSIVDGSGSNGTATLEGSIKYASGTLVRYFFELDTDPAFPSPERTTETKTVAAPFPNVTATGSALSVTGVGVTSLTTGTWYFRLVAITNFETDTESLLYGNVKTFGIGVPVVTTTSLSDGQVSTPYNETLASAGGSGVRTNYTVASGTLPAGLSLSATGGITGTPTAVGLSTIGVTVTDNNGTGQTSATRTLTIRIKSPQTVTIPDPGTKTYGDSTFSVNPSTTVTADEISDLGSYTYSGTSGVCNVDAAGTVTITGAGTCTITVNHTGNGYFLSGSNTRTFTVNPKAISVKADDKSKQVDGTNPSFTYAITVGMLVGSDAIGSLTYTHSSSSYTASTTVPNVVGSYTITPSAAVFSTGLAANYTITYLTGTLTVSAAAATTSTSSSSTTAAPTTTKAPATTAAPTTTVPKVDPRKTTDNPFVNISADPKPNGKQTGGSLNLDGDPPMEVLSVKSSDPTVTVEVTKSGVEYNKPETWVAEGFGDECWKFEPGGSAYILPAVPTPPSGKAGYYSMVKVKAGSITSTDPNFQVNTIFPNPVGGDRVWPDSNRNGIYDAGGKNGDKDISHVIVCIRYGSAPSTSTTSPTGAAGSTTTAPASSGTTTTVASGSSTSSTSSSTTAPASSTSSTTAGSSSSTSSTIAGSSGSTSSSTVAATTPAGSASTATSTTSTTAAGKNGSTTTTLPIDAKDTDGPKDNVVIKVAVGTNRTSTGPVTIVMRMSTGTEESIVSLAVDPATMEVAKVQTQSVAAVDVGVTAMAAKSVVRRVSSSKAALPATGSDSGSVLPWVFVLLGLGVGIRFLGRWTVRRRL